MDQAPYGENFREYNVPGYKHNPDVSHSTPTLHQMLLSEETKDDA